MAWILNVEFEEGKEPHVSIVHGSKNSWVRDPVGSQRGKNRIGDNNRSFSASRGHFDVAVHSKPLQPCTNLSDAMFIFRHYSRTMYYCQ